MRHSRFLAFALPVLTALLLLTACTPPAAPQDPQTPPPATDDTAAGSDDAVQAARRRLADRLDVKASQITVERTKARDWSDSCLGLGGPAESCLTVITPGFAIDLAHDGETYSYRTDRDGTAVRAEE